MAKDLKGLIEERAIHEMLLEYGEYLIRNKIALSINAAMDSMGPLLTLLVDNGEYPAGDITRLQSDLKNKHLIAAGATIKTQVHAYNIHELVEEIVEEVDVNSLTD